MDVGNPPLIREETEDWMADTVLGAEDPVKKTETLTRFAASKNADAGTGAYQEGRQGVYEKGSIPDSFDAINPASDPEPLNAESYSPWLTAMLNSADFGSIISQDPDYTVSGAKSVATHDAPGVAEGTSAVSREQDPGMIELIQSEINMGADYQRSASGVAENFDRQISNSSCGKVTMIIFSYYNALSGFVREYPQVSTSLWIYPRLNGGTNVLLTSLKLYPSIIFVLTSTTYHRLDVWVGEEHFFYSPKTLLNYGRCPSPILAREHHFSTAIEADIRSGSPSP
ncbi:hypothetical protein B0H13DRAFT_1854907 [Mycena leptocephala]|nr:hypothetical protein B0H13DRAFT_1854907 [Mycena leptocephala]